MSLIGLARLPASLLVIAQQTMSVSLTLSFSLFLAGNPAFGQMLANPTTVAAEGRSTVGGGFAVSEIETDIGPDRDIDRKTIFGHGAFGLVRNMDIFGQIGYTLDAEIEDVDDVDGKGFVIGFGPRFAVHETRQLRFNAYGLLNIFNEEYEGEVSGIDVTCDLDQTDLHLGGMALFAVGDNIKPYGGFELILNSSGDYKCKADGSTGRYKEDAERADQLNLHAGLNIYRNGMTIRPALILAGETTFMIEATSTF